MNIKLKPEVLDHISQECLGLLLDKHSNERLLFRSAPSLSDVRVAMAKFAKGSYSLRQESDVHLLGGILTESLRLKTPSLFGEVYDELLTIDFSSEDPLTIKKRIKSIISTMPHHKIEFTRHLFTLLHRIRRLSNDDSMNNSISFLSNSGATSITHPIVSLFCPLLLQPSYSTYMSIRHVSEARSLRPVIAFLIDDYSDIGQTSGLTGSKGKALMSHNSSAIVGYFPQHRGSALINNSPNSACDSMILSISGISIGSNRDRGLSKLLVGGSFSGVVAGGSESSKAAEMDSSISTADEGPSSIYNPSAIELAKSPNNSSRSISNSPDSSGSNSPDSNFGLMEIQILDALLNSQVESFFLSCMAAEIPSEISSGLDSNRMDVIGGSGGPSRPGTPMPHLFNNGGKNRDQLPSTSQSGAMAAGEAGANKGTKKYSRRTKMIQDCRAIRNRIQAFEDNFMRQNGGRAPTNSDKKNNNILELYNDYRLIKRQIRDNAAIDIQRLFRSKRGSNKNNNNNSNNNTNINNNRSTDFNPAMAISPSNSMEIRSMNSFNSDIGEQSLPNNNAYSNKDGNSIYQLEQIYRQLLEDKKELKRSLKKFDDDFLAAHGRHPRRQDKEAIRPLYQKYNELKLKIDEMESHLSINSSDPADSLPPSPMVSLSTPPHSFSTPDHYNGGLNSFVSPSGRGIATEGVNSMNTQINSNVSGGPSPLSQINPSSFASPSMHDNILIGSQNRGKGFASSNDNLSRITPSPISLPQNASASNSLLLLNEEKKALHNFLKDFERDFNEKNGRPVTHHEDILPVAEQYQRYKDLKVIIKEMKGSI